MRPERIGLDDHDGDPDSGNEDQQHEGFLHEPFELRGEREEQKEYKVGTDDCEADEPGNVLGLRDDVDIEDPEGRVQKETEGHCQANMLEGLGEVIGTEIPFQNVIKEPKRGKTDPILVHAKLLPVPTGRAPPPSTR